jgi:serine/threonine protein kinase
VGRLREVTTAADVYGLGAILYYLLTGAPPFRADTVQQTLEEVCTQEPVPPGRLQPGVPRALEALCLQCLRKAPAERPPSAAALAQALRAVGARKETDTDEFDLVPGYELLGELGRGGLGVVYRARHVGLDLPVALKVFGRLRPGLLARIRAANRALARLHHKNILQVYDCGEQDGHLYIAEELVEGGNLAEGLAAPLGPRAAAGLVEALAGAIQHAHDCGIVHRNLKPQVVLLSPDGAPKISSFEMARVLGHEAGQDEPEGTVVGTPRWMAPEQLEGMVERVGPTADVYGLGAVLYHLLTGRPPFPGENLMGILERARGGPPTPPRELNPAVSPCLNAVCLRCLRREPGDRYVSAAALAEDLARYRNGKPVWARRVGVWERFVMWSKRWRQR